MATSPLLISFNVAALIRYPNGAPGSRDAWALLRIWGRPGVLNMGDRRDNIARTAHKDWTTDWRFELGNATMMWERQT